MFWKWKPKKEFSMADVDALRVALRESYGEHIKALAEENERLRQSVATATTIISALERVLFDASIPGEEGFFDASIPGRRRLH